MEHKLKRKLKFIAVDPDQIVTLFNAAARPAGHLTLPVYPDLPDDAICLDAHYDFSRASILMKFHSDVFDEVPEHTPIPVMTAIEYQCKIKPVEKEKAHDGSQ